MRGGEVGVADGDVGDEAGLALELDRHLSLYFNPSGAKAPLIFASVLARLKSCPDTKAGP
jgi:hypothetical protein